jgi:hypothetical protein
MATAKRKPKLFVARQTVTVKLGKEDYPLWAGLTQLPSDHPIVMQHGELFEPAKEAAA